MLVARLSTLALVFLSVICLSETASAGGMKLEQKDGTLVITHNDKLVTRFHYGPDVPKPYFHPVNIPGTDISIVRPLQEPDADGKYAKGYDHKHHRGIWLGVEKVEGLDHWMEKHKIVNRVIGLYTTSGDYVEFLAINDWVDDENKPVLQEQTTWTIRDNGLWQVSIQLTPVADKITIGDTKEGFLGVRMDDDLRGEAGGLMINADGKKGEKEAWGKPSAWVDYTGERNGQRIGVALFDHPANFRESLYHVRNYGLFAISPFGPSAYSNGKEPEQPVILNKKNPVRLRYGIYLHSGSSEDAKVADVYQSFLQK